MDEDCARKIDRDMLDIRLIRQHFREYLEVSREASGAIMPNGRGA
jgi:hypothetical protein